LTPICKKPVSKRVSPGCPAPPPPQRLFTTSLRPYHLLVEVNPTLHPFSPYGRRLNEITCARNGGEVAGIWIKPDPPPLLLPQTLPQPKYDAIKSNIAVPAEPRRSWFEMGFIGEVVRFIFGKSGKHEDIYPSLPRPEGPDFSGEGDWGGGWEIDEGVTRMLETPIRLHTGLLFRHSGDRGGKGILLLKIV